VGGISDTGGVSVSTGTREVPVVPPRRRSIRRLLGVGLLVALVAVVLVPLLTAVHVVLSARADDRTPTDAIVVLGAAQFWGKPSPVLEARLAHAVDLYSAGVSDRVITVGGKQPGDITTEAQAGKVWLTEAGVPASRVVAVPTGSDTLSSLRAVAAVMDKRGWTSATIVTDPVHEARSLAMARALGIEARGSSTDSGSGSSITLDYVARETGGLLWFWLTERRDIDQVVG
jgi:uncharacterized SAM-binding protein YcdF (DUF218 family)